MSSGTQKAVFPLCTAEFLWMQQQTVFTDNGFWKCSSAHALMSTTELCLNPPHLCFSLSAMLFFFFFLLPNHVTNLLPFNLINCAMSQQVFFLLPFFSNFPVFCCHCHNFFEMCCWNQIQNGQILLQKQYHFLVSTFNML